ncbi:hypothetical protein ZIOFF_065743 [Zingiber officinale]|uniref:peptidylprolyl isomerase n=1 Tax=Zingiber officinale TaxID=94328 RepID=A0A8J5EXH2_ZINOF|nr:hypothetical protein ZIOFF_065743 [Zingiber officinale]
MLNADLNLPVDIHPPPSSPPACRSQPCGNLCTHPSTRTGPLKISGVRALDTAERNVRQASRALEQGKALILKGVSETKKEHGKELLEKLAVGMQELEGIIQQRDREAVAPKQKELLQYVGGIEENMVDGFPFKILEEYSNLPLLKGKATVDMKVKVKDNPNVQDYVFRIVLDGSNNYMLCGTASEPQGCDWKVLRRRTIKKTLGFKREDD